MHRGNAPNWTRPAAHKKARYICIGGVDEWDVWVQTEPLDPDHWQVVLNGTEISHRAWGFDFSRTSRDPKRDRIAAHNCHWEDRKSLRTALLMVKLFAPHLNRNVYPSIENLIAEAME